MGGVCASARMQVHLLTDAVRFFGVSVRARASAIYYCICEGIQLHVHVCVCGWCACVRAYGVRAFMRTCACVSWRAWVRVGGWCEMRARVWRACVWRACVRACVCVRASG